MAQGLHLSQKMALQQVLAPQLQQSLALLQAPMLELKALVEQEIQQNPLLEETAAPETAQDESGSGREEAPSPGDPSDPAEPPADVTFDPATEKPSETVDDFQAEFERLAQVDQDWRDSFSQSNAPMRASEEEEERRQYMFDSLVASISLQEQLIEQVRLSDLPVAQRPVAEMIIGNIDDSGYLRASVDELSFSTNYPTGQILEVLKVVQTFHPPGVGARDLRECLLLQLERAGRNESLEYAIINQQMDALGRRRFPEIARALGIGVDEVQQACERISHLEPYPGRDFLPDDQQYVVPEVFVGRVPDDDTPVRLTADEVTDPEGLLGRLRAGADPVCRFLWGRLASWSLTPLDLVDLATLVGRLSAPADPVSRHVADRLSESTREALGDYPGTAREDEFLRESLVEDLNAIIEGPLLGDEQVFASVQPRAETRRVLTQANDPARFNRLLLEDGFPKEFKRIAWRAQETLLSHLIGTLEPKRIADVLAQRLTALIQGPNLYSPERFTGVHLSIRTRRLMGRGLKGNRLFQFNRSLLEDVFTTEIANSLYTISLNNEAVPHLRISNTYKDLMAQPASTPEVREYIREKIRAGKFLIKSLHQRQQTIANIAGEIVARQRDFMERGVSHLKPMTMAQVAEAVGVHETTVSRAVAAKYIETPQGVFEMKYFFTSGIPTASGVGMSNASVKDILNGMIAAEDRSKPLSDEEIVKRLSQNGIMIARRTVAKYRSELNILPSHLRKVY